MKKSVLLVIIGLFILVVGLSGAVKPPGVPHTLLGKIVFYNSSLADNSNVSLYTYDQAPQTAVLEEKMADPEFGGQRVELNLGNMDPDYVWTTNDSNLSISSDLAWQTGDDVLIQAKKYRSDGLVQTAEMNFTLNDSEKGYQVFSNMTLNELPSTPNMTQVDSSKTSSPEVTYVRKPYFNWTNSTDITDGTNIKSLSGADIRYEFQLSNTSSMNYLIMNKTLDDINNLWAENLSESDYFDGLLVGTYYYRVRPYDGIDHGAWSDIKQFVVEPYNFTLELKPGYNLISLPNIVENLSSGKGYKQLSAQQIVDMVGGGIVDSITRWDPQNQQYPLPVCKNMPPMGYMGCDFNLSLGEAFYVEVNQEYNLSLAGRPISEINYDLKPDYNLLGYNNRLKDISAMDYVNKFSDGTIQSITRWDAGNQQYPLPVCKNMPPMGYMGCDFNMSNGYGYFIESSNNANLSLEIKRKTND